MSMLGLKGIHVTCLFYIYTRKVKTAAEIVKLSGEDKAAVSRSTMDLVKGGFLSQDISAYRHTLTLTAKGEELAKYIVKKVDKFVTNVSRDLSETERTALYTALKKVDEKLKILAKSGGEDDQGCS